MPNRDLPTRSSSDLLALRLHSLSDHPPRSDGRYVVYWMQQNRRLFYNHALQHAVYRAREHQVPLLIYEALSCDYQYASDRHHYFALQAMLDHRQALAKHPIGYLPYVEPNPHAGRGLVASLTEQCVEIITDHVPCFIVPRHNRALARIADQQGVRATAVDATGTLPVNLLEEPCPSAAVFRRYAHKHLVQSLTSAPKPNPLAATKQGQDRIPPFHDTLLQHVDQQWKQSHQWLDRFSDDPQSALNELPIDHDVSFIRGRGGRKQGRKELWTWLDYGFERYGERSDPTSPAASGLSPYLHWGMLSPYEIIDAICERECGDDGLDLDRVGDKRGARMGFWPMSEAAQLFLDELITWRELGHHGAQLMPDFEQFDSLPEWARISLAQHQADQRPYQLSYEELESAASPDDIWNAAQRQLRSDGMIHNYLRMLWGKCVIAWKSAPEQAYQDLIKLNNKWALDGHDANSYSGVLWCFGRYDRAWVERDIYGKVRYMTSNSTRKKFKLDPFLQQYSAISAPTL